MTTREICTLQFGHYSNFIGVHWWNIQEHGFSFNSDDPTEINNRVLYREGLTLKGQPTYTPRLLLVDLKGSLNTLPEHGDLYESCILPENDQVLWHDNLVVKEEATKHVKNEFLKDLDASSSLIESKHYNFEENVMVWSDCLYARFHPKTTNIIKEYQHDGLNASFNTFTEGRNLWETEQFNDEFSDNIRNFVEECDNMQGFHILLDATNGFSGLSSDCIEYLRDEYDRKSILVIPVLPSHYKDYNFQTEEEERQSQIMDSIRVINLALSFTSFAENCSLFIPLSVSQNGWRKPGPKKEFNHISYDENLMYHTSAILASALDTFTLKYRLKDTTYSLGDLCADLNQHNRKLAAASLCLPFSFNKDAYLIECLDNWDGPLTQSISPNCNIGSDRIMQLITLRGIPEDRLKKPYAIGESQSTMPAYRCNTVNEMLTYYYSCVSFGTATNVTTISKGLPVKKPYPNFFDSSLGIDGNVHATARQENQYINTIPVLSGLHSGKEIGEMVESLHVEANKIRIGRFHQFLTTGLEKDDYKECLDKLFDLRECYDDNYLL